jgi:FtsZ-interacting cell division protein YlmF
MEEVIKSNKPNISASSLKTYLSLLRSLYFKEHEKGSEIKTEWFNNQDKIMQLLEDKAPSSRKTTYAALIAIAKENDKYKKALINDGKTYDQFIKTQTKTEVQEKNWKSFDDIKKIYEDMYNKVKPLLNLKEIDSNDYKKLQDFIILSLTSGYWIPPRRSQDWTELKIKNIDKEKDNYIDKNSFVFNKFKTAKFYETQKVDIPKGFKAILTKYLKLNKNDYLITDDKGNKLTNVRLTQKLNHIFGNNISTSMLRHIYLTEKLKDVPKLAELDKLAHDMGHSVSEAMEYVKH